MPERVPDLERGEMVALYRETRSRAAVAQRFGRGLSTVHRVLAEAGEASPPGEAAGRPSAEEAPAPSPSADEESGPPLDDSQRGIWTVACEDRAREVDVAPAGAGSPPHAAWRAAYAGAEATASSARLAVIRLAHRGEWPVLAVLPPGATPSELDLQLLADRVAVGLTLRGAVTAWEAACVRAVLKHTSGRVALAAEGAGLPERTLRRLMRVHGVDKREFRPRRKGRARG